jgi:predicted PurR-regulated permease PerM
MPESLNPKVTIDTSTIIRLILWVGLAFLLFYLRSILLVVMAAIVISSSIEPGVRFFVRRKIPRVFAVIIIYIVLALFVGAIFVSVIPPLLSEMSGVVTNIPTYLGQINRVIPLLDESILQGYVPIVSQIAANISNPSFLTSINTSLSQVSGNVLANAALIAGNLFNIILIVVLSFYFSVTEDGVGHFLKIITPLRFESYVASLWKRTKEKIGAWMQGQLLLAVLVGLMVYLGLLLGGIRHALLLAFLAAFLELIPVFGPVLAAIPAIALTLLDRGVVGAGGVFLWYLLVQQFENHLFYPLVVKKIVGISPLLVILALVIGAKLGGILGVILSVPASVLLVEFLEDIDKKKQEQRQQRI